MSNIGDSFNEPLKHERPTASTPPQAITRVCIESGLSEFVAELQDGRTVYIKKTIDLAAFNEELGDGFTPKGAPRTKEWALAIPREVFEAIVEGLDFTKYDI